VLCLEVGVADDANNGEIVETPEVFGQLAFAREEGLTPFTPGLQVIGLRAVFDEADDLVLCGYVVPTNDRGSRFAMLAMDSRAIAGHVRSCWGSESRRSALGQSSNRLSIGGLTI
jgi:hypothetical protein